MELEIGLLLLIVVLIALLVWQRVVYNQTKYRLEQEKKSLTVYHEQLFSDNEKLRSYMDNQHMVWRDDMQPSYFLNHTPAFPALVILIRADELYALFQKQWADGYEVAAATAGLNKSLEARAETIEEAVHDSEGKVVKIHFDFADRRFDHDFARFVNTITRIGEEYGNTQQLRDRMSHFTTAFRLYLARRQDGEKLEFPVEK